jgi:hypothetical protein
MSKLLSVVIAAAFAAVSVSAVAQTKDVKSAEKSAVKSPDGKAVVTKDAKEAPKAAPVPAVTPKAKEPVKAGEVKTKDGPVKSGDKKDVKTETKTK